jgi:hypothetical protein
MASGEICACPRNLEEGLATIVVVLPVSTFTARAIVRSAVRRPPVMSDGRGQSHTSRKSPLANGSKLSPTAVDSERPWARFGHGPAVGFTFAAAFTISRSSEVK